ncbi:MAG: hypothetical protein ACI91B_001665 [Planctomycetota bacterium]|jgi:hypothetical protein
MRTLNLRAASGLVLASVATALLSISATAQTQTPQPTVRQAPPGLLSKFDITRGTVQTIQVLEDATGGFMLPVQVNGQMRTMALMPHDLRGPNFKLMVEDANGLQQLPTPPCVTYRGSVLEDQSIKIAATVVDGTVTATMYELGAGPGLPGKTWAIQPVNSVNPLVAPTLHIVYEVADNSQLPYQCGNLPTPPQPALPASGQDAILECDIACEGDREFWILNGSNITTAQNDITSVMNQIEFIYNRDCDIQYNITQIIISTTAVYTSSDANTLLNQFQSRWNSVHAGIPRDTAHLFTGRQMIGSTIGLAYLSVICSSSSAYGLSESRYTSNFTLRTSLTAHELGHNWSSGHCNAQAQCNIMCSSNGGCSSVTLFSPSAINAITSFAATRNCLTVVPATPFITTVTPQSVTVFSPGAVTLTGTGFTGTTGYSVGGQSFTTGFSVQNDNTMSITIPNGTSLGFQVVTVTNSAGTSNSNIIVYTVTSPPKLELTSTIPSSGGLASFDFGGTAGRQWFLVLGITSATLPFQGHPLLANPLLLTAGTLSPPFGINNLTLPVPPGLGLLIFYAQILEADPTLPIATGTSNVRIIILL